MKWNPYYVVFRLNSPMHIGSGTVGNVQRTYPYVTGRVFWGALTMRLTRNALYSGVKNLGTDPYKTIGKEVHEKIAYTYFYPAIKSDGSYQMMFPWAEDSVDHVIYEAEAVDNQKKLIRSYASTSLEYPNQSAAESLLHESEFITPFTIEKKCQPIYLFGYLIIRDDCSLDWPNTLGHLQFGGDRCYGWGSVSDIECNPCDTALFGGNATLDGTDARPIITLKKGAPLLAHTKAANTEANGSIEPLVGRLWQASAGQNVEFSGICFRPGSRITNDTASFHIGEYGIWS